MSKLDRKGLKKGVHRNLILRTALNFREHRIGISEWIKNSDDSYIRHEKARDLKYGLKDLPVILNISRNAIFCIDFGGANPDILDQHILYYGDPRAATQGKNLEKGTVSGGHGSGGKYYGLAQFDECRIINYYNGLLTTYKLTKKSDESGDFKKEITPKEVAKLIGFDSWSYFNTKPELYRNILSGKLNVFCWMGINPIDKEEISSVRGINKLIKTLEANPQVVPVLKSREVDILFNGRLFLENLKPLSFTEDPTLGKLEFELPDELGKYKFNKMGKSKLIIRFSTEPLIGDKEGLNVLDITARGRSIAYYKLTAFMMDKGPARYMTATIDCPELDDYKCITNERIELAENPVSTLFKDWCKSKIQGVIDEINNKEKKDIEVEELKATKRFLQQVLDKLTTALDEMLLKKVYNPSGTEQAVVEVPTGETGGYGGDGKIKKRGGGKRRGKTETKEGTSVDKKNESKLKIFVSGIDEDPFNKGKSRDMSAREPILDQRTEDVPYGYWWLNSQKEYVKNIKINDPAGRPFYLFLVKEIVLFTQSRKMLEDESVVNKADMLQNLDLNLIDEIFNRVIGELRIPVVTIKAAEVIRNAIRKRKEFTIRELEEETGIKAANINTLLNTVLADELKENFTKTKSLEEGTRSVNLFKRKE